MGIENSYVISLEFTLPDDEYEYEMERISSLDGAEMYYDSKTKRKFNIKGCGVIFYKNSNKISYYESFGFYD